MLHFLNTISTLRVGAIAVALVLLVSACSDDGSGDLDDAERFLGGWEMIDVSDSDGNQLAAFTAQYNTFEVLFASTGSASFNVDAADPGANDIVLSGTYIVSDAQKTVTVTVNPGVAVAISFDYEFESNGNLNVTTSSIPLNLAFGSSLVGDATITLAQS